jgi:hypothetical protein
VEGIVELDGPERMTGWAYTGSWAGGKFSYRRFAKLFGSMVRHAVNLP